MIAPPLCHINLARTFRGGERQTELLIRGLAPHLSAQRAVVRHGAPLAQRLRDVPGVKVVPVRGRLAAVRAAHGAALLHAHETGGAQAAYVHHLVSSVPYLITRRVDNALKPSVFTRAMYRRAAAVVALSEAIAAMLRAYDERLRPLRIPSAASMLPHDAATARAYRARFAGKFLVGHVAALDIAHKNQLVLIEAARRLQSSHPNIHFLIAGSGRDEQQIRAAARELQNMTFVGWVENVGDYLAAFDVFALPSRHEGLGSILIDAMSFGLPIVASAVGGIPELIAHGENGLLVEASDGAALADGIVQLCAEERLRETMARANRTRALEYGPEAMTARYLRLYAQIVPGLLDEAGKAQAAG